MDAIRQYCEKKLQLNYTEKTFRNAISELNKADLLLKARNNIYYINPSYSFKWTDNLDHRKLIMIIQEQTGRILMGDYLKEIKIKGESDSESISGGIKSKDI